MERRTEKPQPLRPQPLMSNVELGMMLVVGLMAVGVAYTLEAVHQLKALVTEPAAAVKGARRLWSKVPFIKK